ncbi:MAG: hypothetical protein WAT79_01845 [Saprospiraceae bacterium]
MIKFNTYKIKNTAIWAVVLIGIGGLLFLSVKRKQNASVNALVIHITAKENGRLVQEDDVRKLVVKSIGFEPKKKSIRKINSKKLEADLKKDPRINNVEVYFDSKDKMHVKLLPKEVIVRISDASGKQYFLDEKGQQVPVMKGGAVRVPLANGHINAYEKGFDTKVGKTALKDIFLIVKYIHKDEFLHALIEQIYVDEAREIILIPKVGKENLVFGGAENMEDKFDNLKIFYRDGMTKLGWNRYPALNLKYLNQVVLVNSSPVNAPVASGETNYIHQH